MEESKLAGRGRGEIPSTNREAGYHGPRGQVTVPKGVSRASNLGSEQVTFRWGSGDAAGLQGFQDFIFVGVDVM